MSHEGCSEAAQRSYCRHLQHKVYDSAQRTHSEKASCIQLLVFCWVLLLLVIAYVYCSQYTGRWQTVTINYIMTDKWMWREQLRHAVYASQLKQVVFFWGVLLMFSLIGRAPSGHRRGGTQTLSSPVSACLLQSCLVIRVKQLQFMTSVSTKWPTDDWETRQTPLTDNTVWIGIYNLSLCNRDIFLSTLNTNEMGM